MPKKTVDGMAPEQYFVQNSRQGQANGADCTEWDYRIVFINDFGFTEGWAYELMKKLIKKYERLGQLTTEKIVYKDGDGKTWHDRLITWKPEFLPQAQKS